VLNLSNIVNNTGVSWNISSLWQSLQYTPKMWRNYSDFGLFVNYAWGSHVMPHSCLSLVIIIIIIIIAIDPCDWVDKLQYTSSHCPFSSVHRERTTMYRLIIMLLEVQCSFSLCPFMKSLTLIFVSVHRSSCVHSTFWFRGGGVCWI